MELDVFCYFCVWSFFLCCLKVLVCDSSVRRWMKIGIVYWGSRSSMWLVSVFGSGFLMIVVIFV